MLKEKISSFINKNIFLCFLGVFVMGGLTVFFIMDKRIDDKYVLEVSSEQNDDATKEDTVEGNITVDISGAVNKPGVYELDNGARVADLLALSEGAIDESSAMWISRNLNLSKKLEDSTKIYIPFEWEFYFPENYQISKTVNKNYASSSGSESSSGESDQDISVVDQTDVSDGGSGDTADSGGVGEDGKINVNTASSSELDELPGIGPAYAEKIIANRPYKDLAEFESKSGLYKSTVANIKDLITF